MTVLPVSGCWSRDAGSACCDSCRLTTSQATREPVARPCTPQPRRHDIDWLRIGATFLLFPFHAARPFDHGSWHVKSPDTATGFDLFVWFIHQFHMPLFFTLAGWSLERFRESALPVYVLHQAVIVVMAYWLVHLALPLAARWLVLMVAALATTLAIYHALVRPFPVMRAAFGLRAGNARGQAAAVAPLSTPSRS